MKSIYLINPRESQPGYFGMEFSGAWGCGDRVAIADLSTTTLAALVPPDWRISLSDERVTPIDLESDAEVIGITGKVTQCARMIELAAHFRSRGQLVVFGGSYVSLNPDDMRPHCDVLVCGEAEEIAQELFADIGAGRWKSEYVGGKVDLSSSPLPRWDLYPEGMALNGTIQTSRGCPFDCEFCDVIQYVGRKQRHKPVDNVLAELDLLYARGFRGVFLADDNFTVYRKRAKELLTALRDWNRAHLRDPVTFSTQVSIDAARDPELLNLCAEAGLRQVFIGIETPNEASLQETNKRQNLKVDLAEELNKFLANGIATTCGIIVGFDSDDPGIFEIQSRFIESLPVPMLTIGALVAPAQTPLHARLSKAGRVLGSDRQMAGSPIDTNIVPKQMTRATLLDGIRELCREVYAPAAFESRVSRFLSTYRSRMGGPLSSPQPVRAGHYVKAVVERLRGLGPDEQKMCERIVGRLETQPMDVRISVIVDLLRYAQIRHMYSAMNLW